MDISIRNVNVETDIQSIRETHVKEKVTAIHPNRLKVARNFIETGEFLPH